VWNSSTQAARSAWKAMGRLDGAELEASGGRRYRAGDLVVALAPSADPAVVTSERGRVLHVDPDAAGMTVHLDTAESSAWPASSWPPTGWPTATP
jgi:hypothetical protein